MNDTLQFMLGFSALTFAIGMATAAVIWAKNRKRW